MQNAVDIAKSGLANRGVRQISFDEFDGAFDVAQPLPIAGDEVINDSNPLSLGKKPVNQVGTDKSSAAAH
jgi:hypothetical protein